MPKLNPSCFQKIINLKKKKRKEKRNCTYLDIFDDCDAVAI